MKSAFVKPVDPPYAERQLQIACALDPNLKHLYSHPIIEIGLDNKGRKKCAIPDKGDMELKVAFFLDGPHHLKLNQQLKDEKINDALKQRGWQVCRRPYDGRPLSKSQKLTITRWMKRELEKVRHLSKMEGEQ